MRFDYLHDAPPEAVGRLRLLCATPHARGILSFLSMAAVVLLCAGSLEALHLRSAQGALADAQARLDRTSTAVAIVNARARKLRAWITLDRQIRAIRESGSLFAEKLTLLADRVPARAWLTSMESGTDGYDLTGRALGIDAVGDALDANPAARLIALRASVGRDMRIVDFQMHVPTP